MIDELCFMRNDNTGMLEIWFEAGYLTTAFAERCEHEKLVDNQPSSYYGMKVCFAVATGNQEKLSALISVLNEWQDSIKDCMEPE